MRMRDFFFAILFASTASAQNVVSINVPDVVDPGLTFTASVRGVNEGSDIPVSFGIAFPPDFVVQSVDKPCEIVASRNGVTCSVDFGFTVGANLVVLAADNRTGSLASVAASIALGNTIFTSIKVPQTFVVDNSNDSGNGSLRDAITNANNGCTFTPCKIAFRIAGQPTRIRPSTPLPAIDGDFIIDGTTQSRGIPGGTIFLDGSDVASGDGITLAGCSGTVQGLSIGNFHGAGVRVRHTTCDDPAFSIAANSIGLDPNDNPAPNDRGVVIDQVIGHHFEHTPVSVTGNVISANRSSGIFVVARPSNPDLFDQTVTPLIVANIIGLDRTLRQSRGNGASGIYIDGSAFVTGNYIAFNHHFGIAVADFTSAAAILPNSIYANWQQGIDIGLTDAAPAFVPLIRGAHYDAATNRTLIDVTVSSHVNGSNLLPVVQFFASDAPHASGFGDGQYFLGTSAAPSGTSFTFAALGDWRGKWVAADEIGQHAEEALNIPILRTSAFSNAVKVE